MEHENQFDPLSIISIIALVAVDAVIWHDIIVSRPPASMHAHFLDVGQGDAELLAFPDGAKVMTDAGPPNGEAVNDLQNILPFGDRYIDIAVISHPQLDHFGGYTGLLDQYSIGAFIYNGRDDTPGVSAWPELLAKIRAKHIPLITLGRGDAIRMAGGEIDFLSPNRDFDKSAELNDTAFVEFARSDDFRVLLTADTGFNVENFLLQTKINLRADVLKVGHHGSKYSSGSGFLKAVDPRAAVIEVGAHNTYGHPSKDALQRIASSTSAIIFRTDRDKSVEMWKENGILHARKADEGS